MLCGTVPFKAQNLDDLHKLILKGEFVFPNLVDGDYTVIIDAPSHLSIEKQIRIEYIGNMGEFC